MAAGLREFEAARPDECELIPSEDQFYGFSRGVNRLSKHLQWVYVPAVKDAASEQVEARNSALGKLLARTVRSKTNFDEEIETLRTQDAAAISGTSRRQPNRSRRYFFRTSDADLRVGAS